MEKVVLFLCVHYLYWFYRFCFNSPSYWTRSSSRWSSLFPSKHSLNLLQAELTFAKQGQMGFYSIFCMTNPWLWPSLIDSSFSFLRVKGWTWSLPPLIPVNWSQTSSFFLLSNWNMPSSLKEQNRPVPAWLLEKACFLWSFCDNQYSELVSSDQGISMCSNSALSYTRDSGV